MSSFLNTLIQRSFNSFKYAKVHSSLTILRRHIILTPKPVNLLLKINFTKSAGSTIKSRLFCTKPYDTNVNVAKDVVIFKYENPKFYKIINIFALCQFLFWNYLSHFAFTTLKDAPIEKPNEDDAWYRKINLGENKYRNGITIFCFLIGYGILVTAWMFTLRSVRYLVLMKGGKHISIVTYGPLNKNRIMKVPVNCISAQESRQTAKVQLPIKVKDKYLFYILDMKGEFTNSKLFDYTAGLNRKI